jgi:formylglycine-generating enzyme required for sulfatase activity
MKGFYSLAILAIVFIVFIGCEKSKVPSNEKEYSSLALGISEKSNRRSAGSSSYKLSEVTHALLTITKDDAVYEDYDLKQVKMSQWGASAEFSTQQIKLLVANGYKLTKFELQNKDNKTIFAAPIKGSKYAAYVSKPLSIDFNITSGGNSKVEIEVVSTENATPSDFGYVSFIVKLTGNKDHNDMVFVKGSTFKLNSHKGDNEISYNVTLSDFYICKYEVTQELWFKIMGTKPLNYKGGKLPVVNISWDEMQTFIRRLNQKTGKKYRLPTEAELIYASIGGEKSKGYEFSGSNTLNDVAWSADNSNRALQIVGTKLPNELGIYDMSGNVHEMCADKTDDTLPINYSSTDVTDPIDTKGDIRIYRGGSFDNQSELYFHVNCHDNHAFWHGRTRNHSYKGTKYGNVGFRLACDK